MTAELPAEIRAKLDNLAVIIAVEVSKILQAAAESAFADGIAARPPEENVELNAKPIPQEMYR